MHTHRTGVQVYLAAAAVGWLAFMVYQLYEPPVFNQNGPVAWSRLWHFGSDPSHLRDWLENALLAFPGGWLLTLYHRARKHRLAWALMAATLAVAGVGLAMEIAQLWMPHRVPSLWDALFMTAGALAGALAGWVSSPVLGYLGSLSHPRSRHVIFLGVPWILWTWIPTHLRLGPDMLGQSLGPLLSPHTIAPGGMLWTCAAWLALATIGRIRKPSTLASMVALAALGPLLAPGRALSWELVGGAVLALAAWPLLRTRSPGHTATLVLALGLLGAAIKVGGLAGSYSYLSFGNILPPGFADLPEPRLVALAAFLEGYWLNATIPFLVMQTSATLGGKKRILLAAGLALAGIQLLSVLWTGKANAITGLAVYAMGSIAAWRAMAMPSSAAPDVPDAPPARTVARDLRGSAPGARSRRSWLRLALAVAVVTLLMAIIVRIPAVPYNVRELFIGRHALQGPLIFALFLLWSAGAPRLAAVALVKWPYLHMAQPLVFLALAVPSWLLLRYSVDAESLHDILGSPILGWSGDWELFGRYLALCASAIVPLVWWNVALEAAWGVRRAPALPHLALAAATAMPVLFLAKVVIIDYASTDNLVELVANASAWPAVLSLFTLVALITLNGALLGFWHRGRRLALCAVSAVLVVATALLALRGLTSPALASLLRLHSSDGVSVLKIFPRWSLLHLGAALVIAGAARLVSDLPTAADSPSEFRAEPQRP